MLVILLAIAALALLTLTIWILRGHRAIGMGGAPVLHRVDTLAFQNLLADEDGEYLRSTLSQADYRQVRRARIRAIQEYLIWIAEDCAMLTAILRLDTAETSIQPETMTREAIRLRLTSLALWSLLWIEYLIPALAFSPGRILAAYEQFRRSAETYLANQAVQPAIAAS
jgi:hypothetical protein